MKVKKLISQNIEGPIVPVMPAFGTDERLDLTSICRWVEWQIDSGTKIFWTTYGTSHYMCLTDEEICELNCAVANVTRGRATLIASTNFTWSVERCLDFIRSAHAWGVDYIKAQVDWRWNPSQDAVYEFYRRLARSTCLPLLAYTLAAPNVKGMNRALLDRVMKLPQFVGLKNDSGDFYETCDYLRGVREAGSNFDVITGGTMASFLHNYSFCARAFATGIGIVFPEVVQRFYAAIKAGNTAECVELVTECEEPMSDLYKRVSVSHWACFHTMLKARGIYGADRLRFPLQTSNANDKDEIHRLMELPTLKA